MVIIFLTAWVVLYAIALNKEKQKVVKVLEMLEKIEEENPYSNINLKEVMDELVK